MARRRRVDLVNPLAALGAAVPSIGGFSPLPVTIMVPFMGLQSGVMARDFGVNYEIGKRMIKSMSNEEFNSESNDHFRGIQDRLNLMATQSVANFQAMIPHYDVIQETIVEKMVEVEKLKVAGTIQLYKELPKEYIDAIFGLTSNLDQIKADIAAGKPTDFIPTSEPFVTPEGKFEEPVETPVTVPVTQIPLAQQTVEQRGYHMPDPPMTNNNAETFHYIEYTYSYDTSVVISTYEVKIGGTQMQHAKQLQYRYNTSFGRVIGTATVRDKAHFLAYQSAYQTFYGVHFAPYQKV